MKIEKCACCGREFPSPGALYFYNEENFIIICPNCYGYKGTCATCQNQQICDFETNVECQEPKTIVETFRQGNTIIQQQIMNPARIDKLCKSCVCAGEETGCGKYHGFCVNYKMIGEI